MKSQRAPGSPDPILLAHLERLKLKVQGEVLQPDDAGYDEARQVWNAMIDKHPAVIVRCAGTADVVETVDFARETGLALAVRGGGHNIAGTALAEGGVVADLSAMKAVQVDPAARRAVVEGGATLSEVDAATQVHGLATPVGINSTTGIGGLTLGGGFGWLSRKHGLTVDNLVGAEVVTAAGAVIRASADEHPELFWALRGGGGNFGAVTRFEFQLHPVGPEIFAGLIVYPFAQAEQVLRGYRDLIAQAPEELSVWVILRQAPPLPFLPESVHGREVVVLAAFHAGDPAQAEALVRPYQELGDPVGAHLGKQLYFDWQRAFDPLLTPGARNYWKSHNFTGLEDGLLDEAVAAAGALPSPHCEIFFGALGGAASRPAPGDTAYPHRDARFVMNVHGRWETAPEDPKGIGWARDFFAATAPYATGGVYVNFLTADEEDRVRAAYGAGYDRLARVKRDYDPENLFRTNWNIRPA